MNTGADFLIDDQVCVPILFLCQIRLAFRMPGSVLHAYTRSVQISFSVTFIFSSLSWRFQMEGINGAAPTTESSFLSFKSYLRKAVLMCIGKGSRGPYLEKLGDRGEDLWLNPGHHQGLKPSTTHHRPGTSTQTPSRVGKGGDSTANSRCTEAGPLVATKTVLLVKGKQRELHCMRDATANRMT